MSHDYDGSNNEPGRPSRVNGDRDADAQDVIRASLDPGERILWIGRPRRGIVLVWMDLMFVPMGLALLTISIQLLFLAPTPRGLGFLGFILLYAVTLGVGLYMMVGRLIYDADVRKRMIYALTDRRAILLSRLFRTTVRSIDLTTLSGLTLEEHRNGRGTIGFGDSTARSGLPPSMGSPPQFFQIEGAKDVYELIRATRKPKDPTG